MTDVSQAPTPRRRWTIAAAIVVLLASVAGMTTAACLAPEWIDGALRSRISAEFERRGFSVSIGTIDWDVVGHITLSGLRTTRDDVVVTVATMGIDVDPWRAVLGRTSDAVRSVEMGAIEVAAPSIDRLAEVRHWKAAGTSAAGSSHTGHARSDMLERFLDGQRFDVTLRIGLAATPLGFTPRLATVDTARPAGSFETRVTASVATTQRGATLTLEGDLDPETLDVLTRGRLRETTPRTHHVAVTINADRPFGLDQLSLSAEMSPTFEFERHGITARGFSAVALSGDSVTLGPVAVSGTVHGHVVDLSLQRVSVRLSADGDEVRLPRVELTGVIARAPGYHLPAGIAPSVDAASVVVHLDRRVAGLIRTHDVAALTSALEVPQDVVVAVEASGLTVQARGHRFGLDRAVLRQTDDGYEASAKGRFGPADADTTGQAATRVLPTLDATVTLSHALRPLHAHVALTEIGPDLDPSAFTRTLHFDPLSRADLLFDVAFAGPRSRQLTATGLVAVRGATFQHWRIAPGNVGPIDARATLSLALDRDLGTATADITGIEVGNAHGDVHFSLERLDSTPRFDVRVHMPKQDCQGVADAVPRGLIATLGRLDVSGTAWFDAHLAVDLADAENLTFDADGSADECIITSLGGATDERIASLGRRFTFYPNINGEKVGVKVGPATHNWVPRKKIPSWLLQAALSTEDGGFYTHGALREGLMRGALKLNFKNRRYVYGGSTITQQLVKNLFLTRHKNLARKLEEAIIATQVERMVSKDRILELYMNCIEYGPKIWGLRAGAKAYFAKEVEELSPAEGIWLMAIKPYPVHAYYVARDRAWNGRWVDRMHGIFDKLVRKGVLTQADMDAAGPTFMPDFAGLRFASLP